MKLNRNNRIMYDDAIYAVAAVIWNTVYLQKTDDQCSDYDYAIDDVYRQYKDVEFVKSKKEQ